MATGLQTDAGGSHLFVETRFKDVCAAARDKDAPIQLSADDLTHYPEGVRRLFRFNGASGYFTLNPLAVAQEPGAAEQFEHDWRADLERVEGLIREGHKHAADVVVDAQVRYAVEHARAGNHLGARYHILWAIPHRPTLFLDFLNEPDFDLMWPFLTELLRASHGDKDFQKRMREVEACTASDPDRAWSLVEETPEAGRTTGLYLLRRAGLYNAEEDYESALPIWAEVRRLWPQDAAAFGNAIDVLWKLGRNDEARRLLAHAPACYPRFRKYWEQMATLEGVRRDFPPAGGTTFRGQPNLGGLLLPENEPAAGSEAKPEPRGIMKELTTEEALKRSAEYARSAGEMLAILRSHNPGYDEATRKLWTQFQEGMDLIVFDDDLEVIYWIKADVERALGERRLDDLKAHLKKALEWCDRHREDIPFEQVGEKFQAALETCERAIGGTSSEQEPPATDL